MPGTLFYNGTVYTADDEQPEADAFVIDDGRFVFVGRKGDAGDFEDMTDLGGRCVIPGLIDSHCHMLAGAVIAALNLVNIDPSTTPAMLGSVIKKELEKQEIPDGGLFAVMGIDLTVGDFSASDIDGYIDDRPVTVFSFDGHALLLNSKAMEALGIDGKTKNPGEDSYYVRNDKGNPTGLVIEIPAMRPCLKIMNITPDDISGVLLETTKAYAKNGYTGVFEAMSVDGDDVNKLEALKALDEKGLLPLRVSTSFGYSGEGFLGADEAVRIMKRNREDFSSENLFHDTLKIISDGTIEERTALLKEPYSDDGVSFGSQMITPEEMKKAVTIAAKEGFSVHIHAIGDEAVSRAIDVLSSAGSISGTKTIAHNQVYGDDEIKKMTEAHDIFFQTTPHWMTGDRHTLSCLGKERYNAQFPVGTMQRNGVTVCFGSDSCLEPETSDAFLGMFYACARGDEALCKDECLGPESESISRQDCLKAYTINCARQLKTDSETGSISAGKTADFVILDRDIMNCPAEELKDTRVLNTYFRGKRTY